MVKQKSLIDHGFPEHLAPGLRKGIIVRPKMKRPAAAQPSRTLGAMWGIAAAKASPKKAAAKAKAPKAKAAPNAKAKAQGKAKAKAAATAVVPEVPAAAAEGAAAAASEPADAAASEPAVAAEGAAAAVAMDGAKDGEMLPRIFRRCIGADVPQDVPRCLHGIGERLVP